MNPRYFLSLDGGTIYKRIDARTHSDAMQRGYEEAARIELSLYFVLQGATDDFDEIIGECGRQYAANTEPARPGGYYLACSWGRRCLMAPNRRSAELEASAYGSRHGLKVRVYDRDDALLATIPPAWTSGDVPMLLFSGADFELAPALN